MGGALRTEGWVDVEAEASTRLPMLAWKARPAPFVDLLVRKNLAIPGSFPSGRDPDRGIAERCFLAQAGTSSSARPKERVIPAPLRALTTVTPGSG